MTPRVLVIDDEPSIGRSLTRVLTDRGYEVHCATTGREGVATAERIRPHIIILDLRLPDASGLDLIEPLRQVEADAQIVVVTAVGDTSSVVRAVKLGALEYLRKPYDLDELLLVMEKAGRSFSEQTHLSGFREKNRSDYDRNELCYECDAMERVWSLVKKVARSDATSVLITGESGTGKELVARALHFESERKAAPFLEINCANFQENLLENELFGHEKGAFTGANQLKRGLAELADGGTLFLDEVGEMPFTTQAKLLRFLESRKFRRVGGNVDLSIDIRIVAATNVDLEERIERQLFRKDLFYRLQVVSLQLPPLRERGSDVCLLAEHFLHRFSSELKKGFEAIDDSVLDAFRAYAWPGNVRELRNLIERIVIIEDDATLRMSHLPEGMQQRRDGRSGPFRGGPRRTLREVEDAYILDVLEECEGNKSRAARILGLSRQGLLDRIKRLESAQAGH
ncbi:MAG: sigma-54-dependent Fis family transcriptional regulator [Candidatus Eisenbacteria bacterium]|uniref:Sigma-54-dependent Fis family transcriptional regulator n=1 Tax=Eiseniibacteriota bacterium TaxID=2212470 RepID=A0A956N9F5_UNCEI|nr:sigma-54-dependent Fis family transcriptional regulator [Candidatus Eisenbacteria bacterium]MCB9463007.1 sigma-54-dependent Fis family transcriptional regulator [Candidatus Eisenbacteria bacterium]